MFMFQAQLCFVCTNPSNARKMQKQVQDHIERFSGLNYAIIGIEDQSKKFGAPDILYVVNGDNGRDHKVLAETKGSWLHSALTSQSLYMQGAGTYFVIEATQGVLRSVQIQNIAAFQR